MSNLPEDRISLRKGKEAKHIIYYIYFSAGISYIYRDKDLILLIF
jgi:hypothetical protein